MTQTLINRQPLSNRDLEGKRLVALTDYSQIIECLEWMCDNAVHTQNVRLRGVDQLPTMPNYYREYRTVIIGGGRQTGKTSWIIDQSVEGTLVLLENAFMAEDVRQQIKARRTHPDAPAAGWVLSMQDYEAMVARGDVKKFKKIIVDDATFVFNKWDIKKFYKTSKIFCDPDTRYYLIG